MYIYSLLLDNINGVGFSLRQKNNAPENSNRKQLMLHISSCAEYLHSSENWKKLQDSLHSLQNKFLHALKE